MIHYSARARVSDGRWDYTCGAHAVGYCGGWREWTADDLKYLGAHAEREAAKLNAKQAPFREKYHRDGHATADDACACYAEYELDQELRFREDCEDARSQHRCRAPGCAAFTSGYARLGQYWQAPLCAAHRTREIVAALYGTPGESWES